MASTSLSKLIVGTAQRRMQGRTSAGWRRPRYSFCKWTDLCIRGLEPNRTWEVGRWAVMEIPLLILHMLGAFVCMYVIHTLVCLYTEYIVCMWCYCLALSNNRSTERPVLLWLNMNVQCVNLKCVLRWSKEKSVLLVISCPSPITRPSNELA